jgi:DNA-binding transcriptional LysR family regulator
VPRAPQEASIRYFLEVARTGSIQEASQRLHVAGSAISRQIAGLEPALGATLFVRQPRGMALTAAGEALALHAQRTALDAERVIFEIRALKGDRGGVVRLAARRASPLIFFRVHWPTSRRDGARCRSTCSSPSPLPRLRAASARATPTSACRSAASPKRASPWPAPVLAMMRAGHPLAGARRTSLARLQEYPLALPSADNTLRQLIDLACSAKRLSLVPAFTSNFAQALCAYVLQGDGITFTAEVSARSFVASGEAVLVPISDRAMSERHLEIQTLSGRALPGFMSDLLIELQNRLRKVAKSHAQDA